MPAGTEFPGFLECIVDVSRGETLLSEESLQSLATLETDVRIKVFVTPTCPYCPQMMRLAFQLALTSPHVRAETIEVNEYPELAQRYQVQAVPMTVINDRFAIPGAVGEKDLVDQVLKQAAEGVPAAAEPVERGKERKSGLIIP
jgi:glutaredoxin-like protein